MPCMCEDDPPEYVISDEAAAYRGCPDESRLAIRSHPLRRIRRHYDALAPRNNHDDRQLDLFSEHPPF